MTIKFGGKKVELMEWTRVQDWCISFEAEPPPPPAGRLGMLMALLGGGKKKKERKKLTKHVRVENIELHELERNRNGRYLFDKLRALSTENMFRDPNYYVLRYHMPGAPFSVNVSLGNNVSSQSFAPSPPSLLMPCHSLFVLLPAHNHHQFQ